MDRRRSQFLRAERRHQCHAAGRRPGSQAGGRWRCRPQHRRHGRLFAGAGVAACAATCGDGAVHQAHRGGNAAKGDMPYMGVLYLGLMITVEGPKLVEYNARFGDPECQVLMPRLKSDLLAALLAARDGKLTPLEWRDETALTVVMASKGYPGAYEKGHVITGLGQGCRDAGHHRVPCRNREARRRYRGGGRQGAECYGAGPGRGGSAGARLCGGGYAIHWEGAFLPHRYWLACDSNPLTGLARAKAPNTMLLWAGFLSILLRVCGADHRPARGAFHL